MKNLKLMLTGPNAGKTVRINGYLFNNGVLEIKDSREDLSGLHRYMTMYYGAINYVDTRNNTVEVVAHRENKDNVSMVSNAKYQKLKRILLALDPNNDKHWTSGGLPRMTVIEESYGESDLVRADINAAYPGFCREEAAKVASELDNDDNRAVV